MPDINSQPAAGTGTGAKVTLSKPATFAALPNWMDFAMPLNRNVVEPQKHRGESEQPFCCALAASEIVPSRSPVPSRPENRLTVVAAVDEYAKDTELAKPSATFRAASAPTAVM